LTKLFAAIGVSVLVFWTLGVIGIGHFEIYYGPEQHDCTPEKP